MNIELGAINAVDLAWMAGIESGNDLLFFVQRVAYERTMLELSRRKEILNMPIMKFTKGKPLLGRIYDRYNNTTDDLETLINNCSVAINADMKNSYYRNGQEKLRAVELVHAAEDLVARYEGLGPMTDSLRVKIGATPIQWARSWRKRLCTRDQSLEANQVDSITAAVTYGLPSTFSLS